MKRFGAVVFAVWLLGCDDQEKKKAELLARTGIEAGAASAAPTGVNIVPPAASTAAAQAAKAQKDCGAGDPGIDDPDMEAELRLKLNKPKDKNPEPLTAKDLAKLTS